MTQIPNSDTQTLLNMERQIKEAELQIARLQGEIRAQYNELMGSFDCANLVQAKKLLTEIDKALNKDIKAFETSIDKLEKSYNWE